MMTKWTNSSAAAHGRTGRNCRTGVTAWLVAGALLLGAPNGLPGLPAANAAPPAAVLQQEGQLPGVDVRLITENKPLTVGDPTTIVVQTIHPTGAQVFLPELGQNWGDFEVRAIAPPVATDNGDGTTTTRQAIDVVLFAPGQFWTPALAVTLSDPSGALSQVPVNPVAVVVNSVLQEGDDTLRDLKPQAEVPLPQSWPFVLGGTLLGLALVVAGGWWSYRMATRRVPVDNRPAVQRATDELGRVATLNLPAQGFFKEHYGLVTDALRDYLERQYQIAALERTTDELVHSLRATPMSDELVRDFSALFAASDLVKFAEFTPTPQAARALVEQARALVVRANDETLAQAAARRAGNTNSSGSGPALAGA